MIGIIGISRRCIMSARPSCNLLNHTESRLQGDGVVKRRHLDGARHRGLVEASRRGHSCMVRASQQAQMLDDGLGHSSSRIASRPRFAGSAERAQLLALLSH